MKLFQKNFCFCLISIVKEIFYFSSHVREEHAVIIAVIVMNLNDHIFLIYPLKLKKKEQCSFT